MTKSNVGVFALVCGLVIALGASARAQSGSPVGTISQVNGTATIDRDGTSIPAASGATVNLHDKITTNPDSYVVVAFSDGSSLWVSPASKIELAEMEMVGGKPVVSHVELTTGNVHVKVPDANGKPTRELTVSSSEPATGRPVAPPQ